MAHAPTQVLSVPVRVSTRFGQEIGFFKVPLPATAGYSAASLRAEKALFSVSGAIADSLCTLLNDPKTLNAPYMVLFFSRDLQNAAGAISALIAVAQFHDQPSQVPQELVANAKRGLESLRFYVPMDADPKTTANLKFLEDFIASTKL